MSEFVVLSHPPFRTGTQVARTKIAFIYNSGGIGDYIYWSQAIRYAIETSPQLYGYIVAPSWFVDLARLFLGDLRDRFKVKEYAGEWADEPYLKNTPCMVPDRKQFANATGFHLHQLGFIYYNQINFIPKGWESPPAVSGDEVDLTRFNLPENYVVITPYATHENRRLRAESINQLTSYLRANEVTPVFLGKSALTLGYEAEVSEGLSHQGVIDLSEGTSLREAACILANARAVIGLDNGLLHLASCSSVPVVFAFTNINPNLRLPVRRGSARTITLTPPKTLECRFCGSAKFLLGHDFKSCMYKDYLCTKLITGADLICAYLEAIK